MQISNKSTANKKWRCYHTSRLNNHMVITYSYFKLLYDGRHYNIETSSLIYSVNQLTGLYMIRVSVMKELREELCDYVHLQHTISKPIVDLPFIQEKHLSATVLPKARTHSIWRSQSKCSNSESFVVAGQTIFIWSIHQRSMQLVT